MLDEQQAVKCINGLKYPIQERMILHDMFSIDEAQNKVMKNERLHSRTQPLRCPMSIEKPLGGEGIQLSFTTGDQPSTQQTVKAPMLTPTTIPAEAKGKEIPILSMGLTTVIDVANMNTSPMSAQREDTSTWRTMKMKMECKLVLCWKTPTLPKSMEITQFVLFINYSATRRSPTPYNDIKSFNQGVWSRTRYAILSSTMKAMRILCLEYLYII